MEATISRRRARRRCRLATAVFVYCPLLLLFIVAVVLATTATTTTKTAATGSWTSKDVRGGNTGNSSRSSRNNHHHLLDPSSSLPQLRRLAELAVQEQQRQLVVQQQHERDRRLQQPNQVLPDGISLQPICKVIENNFRTVSEDDNFFDDGGLPLVVCTCAGSSTRSFAINCEYQRRVCDPLRTTCGRPFVALSLIDFRVFSVTSCVYEYARIRQVNRNNENGVAEEDTVEEEEPLEDICVSMEACSDNYNSRNTGGIAQEESGSGGGFGVVQFCGCVAQYGSEICSECRVCDDDNGNNDRNNGIFLNCTNANSEVVTADRGGDGRCTGVDVDLDLSGATSSITGFIPNLNGLCSELESALDNRVGCSCQDSGRGNFVVQCSTTELVCDTRGMCARVKSAVHYQDGSISSIKSCTDLLSPYDWKETCVTFTVSSTSNSSNENEQQGRGPISGCSATYDGRECRECRLCGVDDGTGVVVDCSNVAEWAVTSSKCQSLRGNSDETMRVPSLAGIGGTLEFVPDFANLPRTATDSSSIAINNNNNNASDNGTSESADTDGKGRSSSSSQSFPQALMGVCAAGLMLASLLHW